MANGGMTFIYWWVYIHSKQLWFYGLITLNCNNNL